MLDGLDGLMDRVVLSAVASVVLIVRYVNVLQLVIRVGCCVGYLALGLTQESSRRRGSRGRLFLPLRIGASS